MHSPLDLGGFQVEIGYNLGVYKRNYYKIQNWLADVGGVLKAIMTGATLINYFMSDYFYFCYIGLILYSDEKVEKPVKMKNQPVSLAMKDQSVK